MKISFSIIFIFSMLVLDFQNTNAQTKSKKENNELVPFRIIHYYGDEYIGKYEMSVYKKNNEYYAENISPFNYYGNKTDSIWRIKLSKQEILICKKFIKIAQSLNGSCQRVSSAYSEYQIISTLDTLEITGDCNCENLDYFNLQKTLFKSKFIELEKKRINIIDSLERKIAGKWYFQPLKNKPKKGDSIRLTRVKTNDSDCYWEFSRKNYFKSSCNTIMDFTYTKDYEWYVNGEINLNISTGIITAKDGSSTVGNYDQSFILKLLNEKELLLAFSWVY